jgi:outer membrane lipoprotein-sorting protein
MKFKINKSIILVTYIFVSYSLFSQNNSLKREIIAKVIDSINAHNQLEFEMFRSERNEKNEFVDGKFYAKMNNSPFKIYVKNEKPKKGAEILYVEGENDNKVLLNTNSFPYVSLSLNSENSLLLSGGHHYIKEAGFGKISKILNFDMKKFQDNFLKKISYEGIYNWNNKKCYKISIDNEDYQPINYYAKKGETLYEICENKLINIAKIKELNPGLDISKKLLDNQEIIITNHYFKILVLYIDLENYFPIYQLVYDENGLYEKYIYTKLVINKLIKNEEFNRDYKDYNF